MKFIKRRLYIDYDRELRDIWIMIAILSLMVVVLGVATLINTLRPVTITEEVVMAERTEEDICSLAVVDCETGRKIDGIITAYTSLSELTDSTPCITASGYNLCTGKYPEVRPIANNCLSFGTIVEIDGFKYTVLDRMNSRYGCENYDIWLPEYEEAVNWGTKKLTVYVND